MGLSLAKIREQFASKEKHTEKPKCPHCGFPLTVEKTDFFQMEMCENCFEHVKITESGQCCESPSLHRVKLYTSGGAIQVREQCTRCGTVKPNSIGGLTKEQRDALPSLDATLRERRNSERQLQYAAFYRRANENKRSNSRKNWLKEYNAYLNSPEWRNKRDLVLKRDNYLCQCCLQSLATQVHHKSYQFVDLAGNEPAFDLVAICTPCHEKIEEMKKAR